ncbi:MAG: rubrerythrin family protein [Verrucomicrobiota bacterium]|jgi:rubrerythrin|nr:rubrerythrin family protein [Verrucomicrobiota bacterium]
MKSIKGSRTEKNLLASFAGESQARTRYSIFAGVARKEGYVQIANIFDETAQQELAHAKRFFSYLEGGKLGVDGMYPAGVIGDTLANLREAADGEHEEWGGLYPENARIAREEGFEEIAVLWERVCVAEKQHEKRYNDLWTNLSEGRVFKRDGVMIWRCLNCGYIHEATEAPKICPACRHPMAYFELLGENW